MEFVVFAVHLQLYKLTHTFQTFCYVTFFVIIIISYGISTWMKTFYTTEHNCYLLHIGGEREFAIDTKDFVLVNIFCSLKCSTFCFDL